ncbi:conserved hypothetical protein [Ixodes scapularis]|uniref:CCHC-type domain-containing protein n=1 Tax=Ixodes scapularis TaxID=6945 RepID=B7Q2C3_IXOSC|nr:conserved hypothetical protein [Ixodes scapularis]|eukprot:XP_002410672.1 conserved hypothetical protein [Ixodes scapularis]
MGLSDVWRFTLTVKIADAAARLRDAGRLVMNGKDYAILPLASKIKNVALLLLPVEVPDEAVAQVLDAYVKVLRMTQETHWEYPTLQTGTRRVTLKIERELPNYISFCGFLGTCLYPGIKKACRRCGQGGHLSYDCRTPRCTRCGEYGYMGSECHAPFRRCGQDYSTSRCHISTYATMLSGEGFQDGQEERKDTPSTSNNREETMSETAEVGDADSEKQEGGASSQINSHEATASSDGGSANPLVSARKELQETTTSTVRLSETSSPASSSGKPSEGNAAREDVEAAMDMSRSP